ncbi:methyl-accepting chemotaxis protein [Bdellovibrio svalbardensis]|uniref:Methyl-accepting chemotaxis protein n=1 Tax=Bdellovibrio svalbardensis TaxID=2972972 RepID=A0ABT6DMB5_9BACT|nr:methyl-accepting chemotaxis protein [Bdellovibrio svalbardensis]MDG0818025.1 methyl-accepting chemotaxis protein [Bdellovibrio svalbardensis]
MAGSKMSLLKRLLLPIIGLSIFILGTMTILSTWKARDMVIEDAKDRLNKAGKYHAAMIRREIEKSMVISRMIALQAQSDIKSKHQNRDGFILSLKEYAEANPNLLGAWIGFEPNAFDGRDSEYANQKLHEKTGRFIPWWARAASGVKYSPMTIEGEGPLDKAAYYRIPMDTKKEALMEPYIDTVDGQKAMMTSSVVPVMIDGKAVGVAGSDIGLTKAAEFLKEVKPYPGSQAILLSFRGNNVAGTAEDKLTKKAEFDFDSAAIFEAISKGQEYNVVAKDSSGQSFMYLVSPIEVGNTGEPWALIIKTPESEVLAGVASLTNFQIFVAIVGIMALAGTVFFISRGISKNVSALSGDLEKSASNVNDSIEQLSIAGMGLSQSSSESAASLEETVAALEELTSMVKMNSDNAKQAAALSSRSSESAVQGEAEMSALLDSMKDISQSSKKIEEIINVIDDIAFQTNLLALNASVEAARAGEHGKGFAVVAEAVRTLSQRAAVAAKDITTLIKDSVEKIERGTDKADKSGEVLKAIVTSVKKVSDLNTEISAASEEQATGIAQISKAMNQLDQSVQSNAASSEEIASTAEEIRSQSRIMRKVTDDLKVVVEGGKGAELEAPPTPAQTSSKKFGKPQAQKTFDRKPAATASTSVKDNKFEDLLPLNDDEAA